MQYLVLAIVAVAIVLLAARAYRLLERWNRRRRLRGAQDVSMPCTIRWLGLRNANPAIPRAQERRCPEAERCRGGCLNSGTALSRRSGRRE